MRNRRFELPITRVVPVARYRENKIQRSCWTTIRVNNAYRDKGESAEETCRPRRDLSKRLDTSVRDVVFQTYIGELD